MSETDTQVTEVQEPWSWNLSPAEYQATIEKIEKINARAAKRGFTGRFEVKATWTVETWTNTLTGLPQTHSYYKTQILGEAPRYANTRFLAKVEWNEGSPIIQSAPGVEVEGGINRAILVDGHCAHCDKVRARKNTFICERDGVQVQIGSSCIKDYLGWSGNPVFIDTKSVESEAEGFLRSGDYSGSYTVLDILAHAWAAIRCFGWVPVSGSRDATPTGVIVKYALGEYKLPRHRPQPGSLYCDHCELVEKLAKLGEYVNEALPRAEAVREYILSEEFKGWSEYVTNLKTLCAAELVVGKFINIVASAHQAYAKHLEQTLIVKTEARPSSHVGAVKERLVLTVKVTGIRYIDRYNQFTGQDEVTVLYTLLDDETGNVFKWFASREALGDVLDVVYKIKGTVKSHDEYKGTKQTVLTRCAFLEEVSA